ncbi:hypothetical protein INS49_002061 [Diaporthe citri]|uniref:uncharacterized protein n=1 Tax=Diaporthe citri TaxID=83186 RepID=UPI001C827FC4|nr:uncharacterized protein INS49_002061 [Diaporthe citri]KAG6367865.1 hypothetical protein INS49_002061 [Diaporthe citri]
MHTFSPTPTQYEIESWVFPHPGVRRLQDASNPGPQRHSLHSVTPRVTATKGEERARLKKGHRRWHSNETRIFHGGPHRSRENKNKGESARTGSLKTTRGQGSVKGGRLIAPIPKVVCVGDVKGRPEHPAIHFASHQHHYFYPNCCLPRLPSGTACHTEYHKVQVESSTPLPSPGHTSLTRQTQLLLHQPSYSSRQSATAFGFHSADSRALLRSLSCRSWTMGAELGPSEGVGESDGQEEPNPAFLGSLDYHDFLHGTSKALGDFSAPRTVLNDKSDKSGPESPVSRFAHKVTQSLSHKPFPDIIKSATTLRERRGQALAEKAGSPEALRKLPKPELSVLTEIPISLTSSTVSPSSSLTTAPLLREGTLRSIPSGPLSTISSKEIDPEKLQPFIGPLLPQQPPPNRPLPQLPFPSPVKRRDPIKKSAASMAGQVDGSEQGFGKGDTKRSIEETTEQHFDQKKGKGLRKKISRFFSNDQPARPADATASTTYQPLSLTASQDTERLSLSDIFDDVYNAARSSLKPGRGSHNSGRSSYQKSDRISISAQSGDFLLPMQTEHHGTHDAKGALATPPTAPYKVEPPPLIDHPVIQDDLEIQDRLGLQINTNAAAIPSPSIPVLPLGVPGLPRPPALSVTGTASKARLVKEESQATITADTHQDIDPFAAFDRTVDLTWPSGRFEHVLTLFVAQYAKGRPFKKHNGKKRFPYFDLPNKIRFEVMRHLVADTDTGKPILLNRQRQASPAWPADAFVSLGSVFKPLQATMWACPRLRAEVMVVLLLTRKFHVIFSPWVKECTQPLPTTWLFRYLHLMQDVSLEIDMTKLGFGHSWESTAMDASLENISGLIRKFTAEMLTRDSANSMGRLTIHCRRYFGYRQEPNAVQGRQGAYKHPLIGGEEDEPRSIVPGQDGSARNGGQPRNYNRRAPSLPPSAAKPYSGHLRHHADLPHRVPYVTEDQLSVASPLRALTGRVDSVRMVGFSEQWTYATHLNMWPEAERNAVSDAVKHYHIDRQTPSRHSYAAPGHAIFLDYGIDHGVHRYPPLPDSEPMVCVDYDRENGLFVELGSGNVVSVTKNGAEFHFRSLDPPTPSRTPVKAAAVLGLPGAMITSGEDEPLATPTKPRTTRKTRAETGHDPAHDPA